MVYRRQYRGRQNLGGSNLGRGMRRRGGGFRWQIMLLFAVGAAFYYFSNQKEVSFLCGDAATQRASGLECRKQLRTMKPAQEMQLGLQSYQQILSDSQVITRGPVVDAVNEIGARIARAAHAAAL